MTVHFIGAGPGAPDLLTLRGRDLIAACPVCLYAGSLVPVEVLGHCPPGARIVNTAPMDLDAIMAEIVSAHAAGHDVARLHSGDLSVWSAMGEQLRRLRAMGVPFTVTPGVPAFAAAAAALEAELTLPGLAQSLVLTRTPGRASAMPEAESLRNFSATGATLAVHLSIQNLDTVVAELTPGYGVDCPVAVVYRASWPDQQIIRGTLGCIGARVGPEITRTALILVGRALAGEGFDDSRLYAGDYDRRYRPQSADSPWHGWVPEAEGGEDAARRTMDEGAHTPPPATGPASRPEDAPGAPTENGALPAPANPGADQKMTLVPDTTPGAPGTTPGAQRDTTAHLRTTPGAQGDTPAEPHDTRSESDRPDE